MKRSLIIATLLLFSTLHMPAQEMVMKVKKTDGTVAKTRVADLKQINFLGLDEDGQTPQPSTMITRLVNGAAFRTEMQEVGDITFADTTYNLNSSGYRVLEANELCWPEDRLLPCFLTPAPTLRSLDMSAAGLSNAERVMFCTLQGIVNRTRPRIILYNHNEEAQTLWPQAHSLKYTSVNGTPYSLVRLYKDEIKGLVLYSNEKSEHYANLAITIAGLDRLLPVTPEVREKLVANSLDFPVVEDLTGLTMNTAQTIYNYLYNNY